MVRQKTLYTRRSCFRMRDRHHMASPFYHFYEAEAQASLQGRYNRSHRGRRDTIMIPEGQKPQSFQADPPCKTHTHLQPHVTLRTRSNRLFPPFRATPSPAIYPEISHYPKVGKPRAAHASSSLSITQSNSK